MLPRPARWLFTSMALLSGLAAAEPVPREDEEKTDSFGAVVAPAMLPRGATSVYGYGGAQEIAAGFRQGLAVFEVEARARFNYFLVAFSAELLLRHTFYRSSSAELAPYLGAGFVYDAGAGYVRNGNFEYSGVRALGGLIATYKIAETVRAVGELDVPMDFVLNPAHGYRFFPLGGGGAEVQLAPDITALLMAQVGVDVFREPLGEPVFYLGYQFRIGLGFRLF